MWHLDARPFSSVILFGQAACLGRPLKPDLRCQGIVQAVSTDSSVRFFSRREEAAPHPPLPACAFRSPLPALAGMFRGQREGQEGGLPGGLG